MKDKVNQSLDNAKKMKDKLSGNINGVKEALNGLPKSLDEFPKDIESLKNNKPLMLVIFGVLIFIILITIMMSDSSEPIQPEQSVVQVTQTQPEITQEKKQIVNAAKSSEPSKKELARLEREEKLRIKREAAAAKRAEQKMRYEAEKAKKEAEKQARIAKREAEKKARDEARLAKENADAEKVAAGLAKVEHLSFNTMKSELYNPVKVNGKAIYLQSSTPSNDKTITFACKQYIELSFSQNSYSCYSPNVTIPVEDFDYYVKMHKVKTCQDKIKAEFETSECETQPTIANEPVDYICYTAMEKCESPKIAKKPSKKESNEVNIW